MYVCIYIYMYIYTHSVYSPISHHKRTMSSTYRWIAEGTPPKQLYSLHLHGHRATHAHEENTIHIRWTTPGLH